MNGTVQLKSLTETDAVVAGYGVVFGGKDLTGDTFDGETNFWPDYTSATPPVLYDHGGDSGPRLSVIGKVINRKADSIGLWVEAQISRSNEYANSILELVQSGKLGWSSGSIGHMVERDNYGLIKSWPIAEFSLTPTPAEPRTIGVTQIKTEQSASATAQAAADADAWKLHAALDIERARAGYPLPTRDIKSGARNAAKDAQRLQSIHDQAVDCGATCPTE